MDVNEKLRNLALAFLENVEKSMNDDFLVNRIMIIYKILKSFLKTFLKIDPIIIKGFFLLK